MKATIDNVCINGCGCVPQNFIYLKTGMAGWTEATGTVCQPRICKIGNIRREPAVPLPFVINLGASNQISLN